MNRKQICSQWLFGITLLLQLSLAMPASAQLLPFGKPKVNDTENLDLTEQSGPWLIMVTSFTGDEGRQQALRLAQELRSEYHLKAYLYEHQFDFNEQLTTKGKGWEVETLPDGEKSIRPIQMKPLSQSSFNEIAVLVGDFPMVDDSHAQKTLEKIKMLQPESLANFDVREAVEGNELAGQRLRAWRGFAGLMNSDPEAKKMGPLRAAFLLTNPLLPDEYFAARKVDQFVIDLNSPIKHSLLKNPGVYSVKVASFSGETTLDLAKMQEMEAEDKWRLRSKTAITQSKLVDAAKKATLLTHELRRRGYEAYEFHDRHESYVCVGSFDWLTQENEQGTSRPNPEIEETIMTFKGKPAQVPGRPDATTAFPLPLKLINAGIACDAQPLPVLVPKREAAKTANRFLGSFR